MFNNFSHSAIKKMDFFMSKLRGFDGRGHFRQYQSPLDKKLCIKTNNFKILSVWDLFCLQNVYDQKYHNIF